MKKLTLFFLFNLVLVISAQAQNQCAEYLKSSDGVAPTVLQEPVFKTEDIVNVHVSKKHPDPIKLNPGDTVWGYYECAQCSTEVSTMPSERRCVNCGKPHTEEPLDEIAPAVFRKTERIGNSTYDNLYLVNPGRLSSDRAMDRLAKEGVADECPFCGVTDFDLSVGCKGCGAETDNANDIRKYALNKRKAMLKGSTRVSQADAEMASGRGLPKLNDNVMAKASPNGPTVTEIETQIELINAENEGRRPRVKNQRSNVQESPLTLKQKLANKLLSRRGALVLAASTFMAATPVGYMWGTTSYTHMAEVINVTPTTVTVEYYKSSGQVEDFILNKNPGDQTKWHIGEQIELYFVNWKFGKPSGGERGNGDVLKP